MGVEVMDIRVILQIGEIDNVAVGTRQTAAGLPVWHAYTRDIAFAAIILRHRMREVVRDSPQHESVSSCGLPNESCVLRSRGCIPELAELARPPTRRYSVTWGSPDFFLKTPQLSFRYFVQSDRKF